MNRCTPPSSPLVLRGKEETAEYLRDVLSRDMKHSVENEVVGEDRVAFNVACEYPDGTRVAGYTSVLRPGALPKEASTGIPHDLGARLFFGSCVIR